MPYEEQTEAELTQSRLRDLITRNPRIIVIGPEAIARDQVQKILSLSGLGVVGEAGYGIEAVSLVQKSEPGVVVIAVEEPLSRSLQTVEALAILLPNSPLGPSPIIGYSTIRNRDGFGGIGLTAMDAGCLFLLDSPVKEEELIKSIHNLVVPEAYVRVHPMPAYFVPIEKLGLSVAAESVLKRSRIRFVTVGTTLERRDELLSLLGRESYHELRQKLDELGFLAYDPVSELPVELLGFRLRFFPMRHPFYCLPCSRQAARRHGWPKLQGDRRKAAVPIVKDSDGRVRHIAIGGSLSRRDWSIQDPGIADGGTIASEARELGFRLVPSLPQELSPSVRCSVCGHRFVERPGEDDG